MDGSFIVWCKDFQLNLNNLKILLSKIINFLKNILRKGS